MTEILRRTGSRALSDHDGKRRSGKRILARLLWELATTGRATLPDGDTLVLSPADWFGVVRFMYTHMEPPRAEMDVTTGGNPLAVSIYLPDNQRNGTVDNSSTDQATAGAAGTVPGDAG